jgi:hypothetical protein
LTEELHISQKRTVCKGTNQKPKQNQTNQRNQSSPNAKPSKTIGKTKKNKKTKQTKTMIPKTKSEPPKKTAVPDGSFGLFVFFVFFGFS